MKVIILTLSLKFSINKIDNLNINHNKKYLLLGDI